MQRMPIPPWKLRVQWAYIHLRGVHLPIAERHGDNLRLSWGMRWRVSTQLHLKRTIQISFWKFLWRVGKLSWQQKRQEFPIAIYVRLGPEEEEEEGGRKTWVWSDRRDGKHLFFNTMRAIRAKFLQGTGKTSSCSRDGFKVAQSDHGFNVANFCHY